MLAPSGMVEAVVGNRPLRVAHLITDLEIGGAEKMLTRLVRTIDRSQMDHLVISMTRPGPLGDALARDGYDVRSLGMHPGRVDLGAVRRLRHLLRDWRADLLETWLYHADLLGAVATLGRGAPPLMWNLRASVMDMTRYRRVSGWTRALCARLSRLPVIVAANSEAGVREHAALGYRPKAWRVLPNGVNTDEYAPDAAARAGLRAELAIDAGSLVVGVAARVDPMKGHDLLTDVLASWLPAAPDVTVVVAGAGVSWEAADYARLARRWPAAVARMRLLGPRDDMPAVWNACDVACAPSHGEGFPNSVVEAMATSLPVVVTDVGDSARLVDDPALVVPPRDAAALQRALAMVATLPAAERLALGARSRARAVAEYSIARAAERYVEAYGEAIATAHG